MFLLTVTVSQTFFVLMTMTSLKIAGLQCSLQFLLYDTVRCYRLILYISCPSLRISQFLKNSWFLLLVNVIRTQDLVSSVFIATKYH